MKWEKLFWLWKPALTCSIACVAGSIIVLRHVSTGVILFKRVGVWQVQIGGVM